MESSRTRGVEERARSGFAGVLEVLEGPTGRRLWPQEVKGKPPVRAADLVADAA